MMNDPAIRRMIGPLRAVADRAPTGRRRIVLVGCGAATVAVVVGVVLVAGGDSAEGQAGSAGGTGTAAVTKTDLVVTDSFDGSLGFGGERKITSGRSGVVTSVPEVGTTVNPLQPLYSVDLQPTVLLTGAIPAYRTLDTGSADGPDIAQLEQALVDAGFGDGVTVDNDFTSATAAAVEDWESSLGRADPDGVVELGDVVFAPGPLRVAEVTADLGNQVQSGSPVYTATSTERVVNVDLDANLGGQVDVGMKVTLTMPRGEETGGTISSIGAEVEATSAAPDAGPTVPIVITLDDPAAAADFDSGSVDVALERSRTDGVLAVPVTALLALAEGGYAVQVIDPAAPGGSRLVAVDVGTYADDQVEISGAGIDEGTEVVVAE